jgi:LPS-assembly protein
MYHIFDIYHYTILWIMAWSNENLNLILSMRGIRLFLMGCFLGGILFDPAQAAQESPPLINSVKKTPDSKVPTFLQADSMEYDALNQIVTASGHVYITQDDQLLSADKVHYYKGADKVVAEGHVWLRDKEGNFSFADHVTLSNKMGDGFVENIKILLLDDSRMAGNRAKRYDGKRVVVWQGVYSPCEVCKVDPRSPLWQLKADKILHNQDTKLIQYHHAWMELFGWPIFYIPYFYHPDPTVKRKTGFLMPIYGHSTDLGYSLTIPYFIETGQNHDFTFYPTFTTKQGLIPALEHRYRFKDGEYVMHGSYAGGTKTGFPPEADPHHFPRAPKNRWHYFMNARYDMTPDILFTLQIQRASDLTYLKRFPVLPKAVTDPFAASTSLTSTAALERFRPDSYGVIRSYVFQANEQRTVPVVLPIAQYSYESLPGLYGETFMADVNFLNLYRTRGIVGRVAESMVRGSLGIGGQIPYVSPWGDVWTLKAYMRGDIYYMDAYEARPGERSRDGSRHRYFPQASLTWRYPFLKATKSFHWILEPAAMLTMSSVGGNSIDIPNEDTPLVWVDTTNLFLSNRMYGIDRVDSGQRVVYGLNSRQLFSCARKFNLFFGQSVRIDKHQVLPLLSGEDKKASNFVSSLQIVPVSWLDLSSRMMLNRKNMNIDVAESSAALKSRWVTGTLGHVFYNKRLTVNHRRISQLVWNIILGKYKGFSVTYGEMRNLNARRPERSFVKPMRLLNRTISLRHENDCLTSTLSLIRIGFRDRDLKPDTRIILQLDFKNLGTVYPVNISGVGSGRQTPVPQTAMDRGT